MDNPNSSSSISPKKRKSRAGQSIKTVDLAKVHKKLLNVLAREANGLLEESHKGQLSKESCNALQGYLKLLKDLKKFADDEEANLTDAELEAMAGETDGQPT